MRTDLAEYWEQRLAGGPSLQQVGFRALGRRFNEWMYRVRRAGFLREMRAAMREAGMDPATARILDAGCGSGFYLERWQELGIRSISGCDLTEAAVTALRGRFPRLGFQQADIGLPDALFPQGRYDAISCMDVLFHIVDDRKYETAFENFSLMLRPGGLLVFTENCLHGPAIRTPYQASRTLAEIEAVLDRTDFTIVSRKPVFVLMNTPVDSTSALLRTYWNLLMRVVSCSEALGGIAGALLSILEIPLTRLLREGPSTELLICRRRL